MPFRSQAQRRWMYAQKPEMARRWEKETPKGKKLPEQVAKINGKKLIDVTRLARMRSGKTLVGKMKGGCDYFLHTLIFDKRSFPTRESVSGWIRTKNYMGAKHGAIIDKLGEWHVRQGSADISGLDNGRVRCDVGVQAILGMPRAIEKSLPIQGKPQHIGFTVRPETLMPEFPDWENLYFSPEAQKRQDEEAKKALQRRKSLWRDLNYSGFHGVADDKVSLRYDYGEKGSVESRPVHYLTAAQLRQDKKRIADSAITYEQIQGKVKR